jgi:hypothetical protein
MVFLFDVEADVDGVIGAGDVLSMPMPNAAGIEQYEYDTMHAVFVAVLKKHAPQYVDEFTKLYPAPNRKEWKYTLESTVTFGSTFESTFGHLNNVQVDIPGHQETRKLNLVLDKHRTSKGYWLKYQGTEDACLRELTKVLTTNIETLMEHQHTDTAKTDAAACAMRRVLSVIRAVGPPGMCDHLYINPYLRHVRIPVLLEKEPLTFQEQNQYITANGKTGKQCAHVNVQYTEGSQERWKVTGPPEENSAKLIFGYHLITIKPRVE